MNENDTITVPAEDRTLIVVAESRQICVPVECRVIEVPRYRTMSILGSKKHTVGDTARWVVAYGDSLPNTAIIQAISVTSPSTTCTIGTPAPSFQGSDVIFFLTGGALGETFSVMLQMTDSFGNIKHDTIAFTVVAA